MNFTFCNTYIYTFYYMTYMAKEQHVYIFFSNQKNNISNQVVKKVGIKNTFDFALKYKNNV